MRIRGFRHKGLKRLYEADEARGVRADLTSKLKVILHAIEQAQRIEQVAKLPGWRLHSLKGGRRGEWSLWVTGNFRLTFRVDGDDVNDIDLEDYH
jgi:proteic killer suppression protein